MLSNPQKGETSLEVNGKARRLCLTLGALAKMEQAFEVQSMAQLAGRLEQLSARDLLILVEAMMIDEEGVGDISTDLCSAALDPREAAQAIQQCFKLAFPKIPAHREI